MKIKRSELKQIIQEEIANSVDEGFLDKIKGAVGMDPGDGRALNRALAAMRDAAGEGAPRREFLKLTNAVYTASEAHGGARQAKVDDVQVPKIQKQWVARVQEIGDAAEVAEAERYISDMRSRIDTERNRAARGTRRAARDREEREAPFDQDPTALQCDPRKGITDPRCPKGYQHGEGGYGGFSGYTESQLHDIIKEEIAKSVDEGFMDRLKSKVGLGPEAAEIAVNFANELERVVNSSTLMRRVGHSKSARNWHRGASQVGETAPEGLGRNLSPDTAGDIKRAANQFHSNLEGAGFYELLSNIAPEKATQLHAALQADAGSNRAPTRLSRNLRQAVGYKLADDINAHADDDLIYEVIPKLVKLLKQDYILQSYSLAAWAAENAEKITAGYSGAQNQTGVDRYGTSVR